jgi:hypothetical protein
MSAALEEREETRQESMAARLGRAPLPIAEALRYSTQIAAFLRDLHVQGLVYGAVSSHLILLGPSGAFLRVTGALARLGDARADVTAFGTVLSEMARRTEGSPEFQRELEALAGRCREESPEMQQVLITLRLLALAARQLQAPPRKPAPIAPLHNWARTVPLWKPLANLAAFALSGK